MKSEPPISNDLHPIGTPTITSKFHRSSSQQGSRPSFFFTAAKDLWILEMFFQLREILPHGLIEIKGLNLSGSDEFKVYIKRITVFFSDRAFLLGSFQNVSEKELLEPNWTNEHVKLEMWRGSISKLQVQDPPKKILILLMKILYQLIW